MTPRRNALATREALWGYAMVAPMVLGLGIFFYLAMGASFFIGFTKWDVLTPPQWIGFDNYLRLFRTPLFINTLWNTTRYTLLTVPLGSAVSLGLALALNTQIRFRSLYRLMYFLPVLTMPVAIAIVWKWIYNPDFGLLNQFLPGKYDPPDFALKLATKDVKLATQLGRELGVPMRICNLAYAEMREACNRGWEGRDSRSVMLLEQERAGVKIAADPERVKRAAERATSG